MLLILQLISFQFDLTKIGTKEIYLLLQFLKGVLLGSEGSKANFKRQILTAIPTA